MDKFVRACRVEELGPGQMRAVEAGPESILLANVDGEFFAVSNDCTHAEGYLSDGFLEGAEVECPWHYSRFNVRTGDPTQEPAMQPLKKYAVKVENGEIWVGPAS